MEEVILYSNGCPKCKVLETKLKQKGVQFDYVTDIETMLEKGFMSMPMMEVDGVALDFTKAVEWTNSK